MLIECPHCKKELQISTKQLNKYGLVEGSKGDFICGLISKKGITLVELITKVDEKYPNKNNIARILRVINELKNKKVLVQKSNLYCLIEN